MKKMFPLVTLLSLVVFVSGAMAIRKPTPEPAPEAFAVTGPEKTMKFSGVIEKVDEIGKTIAVRGKMTKEEKILTFTVEDKTKINKGKTTLPLRDLKKDMQVSVQYKKEMDRIIAIAIEVSIP